MSKRKGGVLVLVAASTAVLMAAGAMVVDLGAGVQARTHQQAATDAGALAAAYHLAGRPDARAATSTAVDWVARNGEATSPGNVAVWAQPDGTPAVTVRATKRVDTSFARFFGVNGYDVATASSAALRGVGEVPTGALPVGLPARQGCGGAWEVMTEAGGCHPYDHVAEGTTFKLDLPSHCGQDSNVVPLTLEGDGHDCFVGALREGSTMPMAFGSHVRTGDADADALATGLRGRVGDTVMVPLVDADDFEAHRSTARVVGVVAMQVTGVAADGTVLAKYAPTVVAAAAAHTEGGGGLGVYAPVLIDTPGATTTTASR